MATGFRPENFMMHPDTKTDRRRPRDVSGVMLEPILDLWRDLVAAGGMPNLTPEHVEAIAVALKRAAEGGRK